MDADKDVSANFGAIQPNYIFYLPLVLRADTGRPR
jgi:hypothetical protein